MLPSKSRLLISIPVSPRSLTCLSLPIPTVKAIAQRPHRTLAPFLFPSSYPRMTRRRCGSEGSEKMFSPFFFSSSQVMCSLGSGARFRGTVLKSYSKPTTGKSVSSFKLSLGKAPTISRNHQYMVTVHQNGMAFPPS